ncbi:MAG TPA: hypothetical protein VH109_13240 [Steroidobacteraceae bacterium]|nr:hypothetical protein [Steroidobacteraceae bacterium]
MPMLSKTLLRRRALLILPVVVCLAIAGSCSGGGSGGGSTPPPPPSITVAISPARAGITTAQSLKLVATTNDTAGVNWSATPAGGSFSSSSSSSGTDVTFTPSQTAGVYTVTATSVSNAMVSASTSVGVTDLAGVLTYHNDLARDGANIQEYALTPATVTANTFGKLFSCAADGAIYAQPLWVANLTIGGAQHNVVFVATEHDSLYAFDADANPCQVLWQVSLLDAAHGAGAGETTVPSGTSNYLVGLGFGSISPEIGITGTPVIDPAAGILYVVSNSALVSSKTVLQRLHAIDIASGAEKPGSPVLVTASFPTDSGGTVAFDPLQERQRGGLALAGNTVYVTWASHDDAPAWYGWLMGYRFDGTAFTQTAVFNSEPNTSEGGIWMGGGAPAADTAGHLYVITGNGNFDAVDTSGGPTDDYGDSFLQLTPQAAPGAPSAALKVTSFFAGSNQATEAGNDMDQGSGGAAVVLNLAGGSPQHLILGGGKLGQLYLLDGDNMGRSGDTNARQVIQLGTAAAPQGIFATSAFWNNTLFIAPIGPLYAFAFDPNAKLLASTPAAQSSDLFGFPGASPSISASSASGDGIVWAINSDPYCTPPSTKCSPAVLHAYDASNVANELWNSAGAAADTAGNPVKFTVPTIANGKVYIGTRGNDAGVAGTTYSTPGELDVYGLKSD